MSLNSTESFSSVLNNVEVCNAYLNSTIANNATPLFPHLIGNQLDTSILDSFGTQYRSPPSHDLDQNENMDELFDILNIPQPTEEHKFTYANFPPVNIDELCEMFRVIYYALRKLIIQMKAHCDKIKDVKIGIKNAWENGDREEVCFLLILL